MNETMNDIFRFLLKAGTKTLVSLLNIKTIDF